MRLYLNPRSKIIIDEIAAHLRSQAYTVRSYLFDIHTGCHAIETSFCGLTVNLWLIYPGIDGEINSIALYGANLENHLKEIQSTMKIFGLPIDSAEIDYTGKSNFIDIFLKPY